jgi:ABC-type multidrug transport system fused ATPase/permease subunit
MLLSRIMSKIRYITYLVVSTPRFGLIISMQLISGAFTFIGLPMIIPILEYMQPNGPSEQTVKALSSISWILKSIGLQTNFNTLLFLFVCLLLMGQVLVVASSLIAVWSQNDLSRQYRRKILNAYKDVDWLWLTNYHSGEMVHSVVQEVSFATTANLNAQRFVIYSIQGIAYMALAFRISMMSSILVMGLYLVLSYINLLNARHVARINDSFNKEMGMLSRLLIGLQQNKKFFKTSLLNNTFINRLYDNIDKIVGLIKSVNLWIQLQNGWNFVFTFLFLVCLILFRQPLSLNHYQLLLIVFVFNRMAPQFIQLSTAYIGMNSHIPMHRSLQKRLTDLNKNKEKNGNKAYDGEAQVRFENVDFSYPNGNQIIKNFNLTIQPNKTVAFVGGSGAGKSTILDLILGLLKPDSGTVYYGLIPHGELDLKSLRSKVAYVSQTPTLLAGTLRENLTVGCPNADEAAINDICKKVHLDKLIEKLPDGLETIVGENGIKLSGGQRQRVVLGRSLFLKPKILVLDEATSELDLESESMIQQTINDLHSKLMIIIVAHRLSTVKSADLIHVIEDGQICESGTYKELLEQKGRLYYLDSLQKVE